jgi:hypothetical protein
MISGFALILSVYLKLRRVFHTIKSVRDGVAKLYAVLKNRLSTNAIAENTEIVYQDLVQNITPVMADLDIAPRKTDEHVLWRSLGGIIDEYGKNPFVLEKLRRGIKLDAAIARNVDLFLNHANKLLAHLSETDSSGLLAATFTDGLLGQSITLFAGAKQLAQNGS